jgi:hypothetical protein
LLREGSTTKTAVSLWWKTHSHQFRLPTLRPVSFHRGSGQQTRADEACLPREGVTGRVEHVDEGAFADVEAEEVGDEPREPLEGDALGEAQIDHQRAQVRSERGSLRKSFRRRSLEPSGATRAASTEERNTCHVGPDRWDLDMIVSLARDLRAARYVCPAMPAERGRRVDLRRRVGMQRTVRAEVRLALDFLIGGGRLRRLAPLRGRRARIVRRLWRQAEPGFEFRDTRRQHLDLPGQRGNRFRLRQNQADQCFLVERFNCFPIHPELESVPQPLVKIIRRASN